MRQNRGFVKFSKISIMHYAKFVLRSLFFLTALGFYIWQRVKWGEFEGVSADVGKPFAILSLVAFGALFVDMVCRFFPVKHESMGCQKQFKKNYLPTGTEERPNRVEWWRTLLVVAAWVLLNGAIGLLYFFVPGVDAGVLILVSLFYSVSDMICILFFCPFQTWFLRNKCCGTCRIYNWDFPMMFTSLVFLFKDPVSWILVGTALALLIEWEILYHVHPERFTENTNRSLACANCKEKLCHHKRQLRSFLKAIGREIKEIKTKESKEG